MKLLTVAVLSLFPLVCEAHHSMAGVPVRSAHCGWVQGDSLRDVRNVSEFCAQSIGTEFRIDAVTSDREHLWIEAPRQLVVGVRSGDRDARLRLATWLREWRRISGFRAASVSLVVNHVDVVTARATMRGDVIALR